MVLQFAASYRTKVLYNNDINIMLHNHTGRKFDSARGERGGMFKISNSPPLTIIVKIPFADSISIDHALFWNLKEFPRLKQ